MIQSVILNSQIKMTAPVDYKKASSIYDFTVKDSFGNDVNLSQYKGNVVVIVNIASQCGLTKSNYARLTDLNKKYNDAGNRFYYQKCPNVRSKKPLNFTGLRILSFPCNQFGSQSPENDGEDMVRKMHSLRFGSKLLWVFYRFAI